ncbi:polysaccharide deacetylase family protein [Sphingobacterium sp. N143]|uniref:polysaccharide deacetylase family protein n=1 Tax=Sphingobacterium sp. N143 TaxID=2746727 RepID=UPI0025776232|nr:polysaccharide deacetylase family protein [Sphingobacterium sp. N143]MDM1294089.1 polysaccharide deacetylase family protein [Sphingobacterium sp. N143]
MKKVGNWDIMSVCVGIVMLGLHSCDRIEGNKVKRLDSVDMAQHKRDSLIIVQDSISKVDSLRKDSITKMEESITYHGAKDTTVLLTDSVSPRYIYLTFDDGPLNGSQYLDSIATAKDVRISAFLIGEHDKMSKKLHGYTERYKSNPLVDCYNHSFWHAHNKYSTFYADPQAAFEDFEHAEQSLGLEHKIVRLPGRNIWYVGDRKRIDLESGASTAELLHQNGYKIMGWDCEWKINGVTGKPDLTVNQLYTQIKNLLHKGTSYTKNNVVLLTHDNMYQTKKGQKLLSDLIDSLKQHPNYRFEFMRNYPN